MPNFSLPRLKTVLFIAAVVLGVWFIGSWLKQEARQLRLLEQASRVGMSETALEAVAEGVDAVQGVSRADAYDVTWLLACTGIPTATTIDGLARSAAAMLKNTSMSHREAVLRTLGQPTAGVEVFNGCE